MKCNNCGYKFVKGDKFCKKCGVSVSQATPTSKTGAEKKRLRVLLPIISGIALVVVVGLFFLFRNGADNNGGLLPETTPPSYDEHNTNADPPDEESNTASPTDTDTVDAIETEQINEREIIAYNFGGSNFFGLRDLMRALNINLSRDETGTLRIDTSIPYTEGT